MQFDLSREWLETNGIGGFASSTVIGANTRRYHALLCAATRAPQERAILVSKADETLTVFTSSGSEHFELSTNLWPGTVSPAGYGYIAEFHLDPLPRWVYEIPSSEGLVRLQKTLWMPVEHNTTVVEYTLLEGPASQIAIRPFVTGRDYHSTHRANTHFNTRPEVSPGIVAMKPYPGLPWVVFSHEGQFFNDGAWYYDFEWPIEQQRGLDFHEDAYAAGTFVLKLEAEHPKHLIVSTSPQSVTLTAATKEKEIERRTELVEGREWTEPQAKLRLGADQFIVQREDGLHTILAGYPWFTDWGRDTMIALPGLCLTTGRYDIARSILLSFANSMSRGMIPNRFPEAGETPDYNTVDATLWFFHAVSQYGEISGDMETVGNLYPRLVESIEWHLTGTRFGIQADDEDGLLNAGDPNSQLTWMDAKVGDVAFTPRNGKPVEIQALWFNALRFMAQASKTFGNEDMAGICGEWSRKIAASFPNLFWNEGEGCLYDCINGEFRDASVRPNQVLAVSLPHRLLPREREARVVARVQADLLTPYGLRSLSPKDKRYRGIYRGDQWTRDSSYHQGTVWAWPIGPFLTGYLKVNEYSDLARAQVREWLRPLLHHLDEAGLNSISEIFDGDPPHHPRGCFAQAWSVSEVLRVLEDVEKK
jgi:predicted glycogen debranching enzyme